MGEISVLTSTLERTGKEWRPKGVDIALLVEITALEAEGLRVALLEDVTLVALPAEDPRPEVPQEEEEVVVPEEELTGDFLVLQAHIVATTLKDIQGVPHQGVMKEEAAEVLTRNLIVKEKTVIVQGDFPAHLEETIKAADRSWTFLWCDWIIKQIW
jgi:hypothetical protein